MTDGAIQDALDVCFVGFCTIVAEVWMIAMAYGFYWFWTKP